MSIQRDRNVNRLILRSVSFSYVGILLILPIFALFAMAFKEGFTSVLEQFQEPTALHALKITIFYALFIVVLNIITGTAMAWILVRYPFPLKRIINSLVDLPFAIPTVVTGIMLVALYGPRSILGALFSKAGIDILYHAPGIILSLLYVTFPFVVRTVQPILLEMEKEMEEAAQTLGASRFVVFRKIIIPQLLPAILTGSALAFSRAIGEFGSIVVVAGNIPMKTQVAAVYIYGEVESGNIPGAVALSAILLSISFLIIMLLNTLQKWHLRTR